MISITDDVFVIPTVTRQVPLAEQKLLTLPVNPWFFCGIPFAQSFLFCVEFCQSLFVFLLFLYGCKKF